MRRASRSRRFFASIIDTLLVGIIVSVLTFINMLLSRGLVDQRIVPESSQIITFFYTINLLTLLLTDALYHIFYESGASQATPGKKIFGLYVVTTSGENLSIALAAWRYILFRVSMVSAFLWLVPFLFGKRGFHDVLSSTEVLNKEEDIYYSQHRSFKEVN